MWPPSILEETLRQIPLLLVHLSWLGFCVSEIVLQKLKSCSCVSFLFRASLFCQSCEHLIFLLTFGMLVSSTVFLVAVKNVFFRMLHYMMKECLFGVNAHVCINVITYVNVFDNFFQVRLSHLARAAMSYTEAKNIWFGPRQVCHSTLNDALICLNHTPLYLPWLLVMCSCWYDHTYRILRRYLYINKT